MSMTTSTAPLLFDQWTALDYKQVLADRYRFGINWLAPTWVGEHRRRLQSYAMLQAYRDNAARMFVQVLNGEDLETQKNKREYGDAALLIEQVRSSLIGDQQAIVLQDADKYEEDGKSQDPAFKAAAERQDFLRQWAEDERMATKVVETERDAVSFGDGVYTLSWDAAKQRPVLTCYDPGNYFPVLDSISTNDYPTKVHLAWELTKDEAIAKGYKPGEIVIHRITYELQDVDPYFVPWDVEEATQACFMSEAEWTLSADTRTPEDLSQDNAIYMVDDDNNEINNKNLGIDFIPVIHIPNTVAEKDHYGKSILPNVLQILDDLQLTDSDLQAAAATTGSPMYALSGAATPGMNVNVGPNQALLLGENGRADVLSGSEGLQALADYRDDLRDRISVNARVPAAVLGRIDPGKIKAGVILTLSFGPMASLIEEMRLARKDKYRVMLRFVQRFFLKNGQIQGDVIDGDLVFGSYLPSDRTGTVADVVAAYGAGLISQATGMKMLQEVGVPIGDISEEIKAINARDFAAGIQLLDATGNDGAVSDFLGVKVQPPPAPLPPQPAPEAFPVDPHEGQPKNQQQQP